MASRLVNCWRSVASRVGATRTMGTATATPMKPYSPTAEFMDHHHHHHGSKSQGVRGDMVPVYVVLGMILLSLSFGAHTAKQQLMHSPNVRLSKKKRESVPEVDDPDRVATESDRFVNKSLFRKVAHIQDLDAVRSGSSDPTRRNPFTHPRRVETLKSVGVDPRSH